MLILDLAVDYVAMLNFFKYVENTLIHLCCISIFIHIKIQNEQREEGTWERGRRRGRGKPKLRNQYKRNKLILIYWPGTHVSGSKHLVTRKGI